MNRKINCQICDSKNTSILLDLGNQPNGNNFLVHPNDEAPTTSLKYMICNSCFSIFQINLFSDYYLYSNHPYLTAPNYQYLRELENFAHLISNKIDLNKGDLVLDIGCNDGSLLNVFRQFGASILGVDPSDTAYRYSTQLNIPVLKKFWTTKLADELKDRQVSPKLIISTASFYHMNDINDWIRGITKLLKKGSYFAVQFVYSVDILQNRSFDQFYHEHTFLHCINSVNRICKKNNLQIIFAEKNEVQGGSYVVIIQKSDGRNPFQVNLDEIIDKENSFFCNFSINDFLKALQNRREVWTHISNRFIQSKQKLIGVGASLRGISLINYFDINPLIFECIFEINKEKIGRWTAGKGIRIVEENIKLNKWNYLLFLAWTQKDILEKKRFLEVENSSKSILIPSSTFEIIGPDPLNLRNIV